MEKAMNNCSIPEQRKIKTDGIETAYYQASNPGKPKLMLVHGNASSSVFYVPLMEKLKEDFDIAVPDLRGFGNSEARPIDATRGMRTWSEDLDAFARALGWDKFSLMGWSLGGGVAEQYAIDHPEKLDALILEAPCPPFGFGGTSDENGAMLQPVNIGSGAGTTSKALAKAMRENDRELIRTMIRNVYCKPGFLMDPVWEEAMIDGVLSVRLGEDYYPGNTLESDVWPYVIAGDKGICNTMAPLYCNTSALADLDPIVPVLWFQGTDDVIVSDHSSSDINVQGERGIVSGWPGKEKAPAQPMVSQTRKMLDRYRKRGAVIREVSVPDSGHACHLEQEDLVADEIRDFILG